MTSPYAAETEALKSLRVGERTCTRILHTDALAVAHSIAADIYLHLYEKFPKIHFKVSVEGRKVYVARCSRGNPNSLFAKSNHPSNKGA